MIKKLAIFLTLTSTLYAQQFVITSLENILKNHTNIAYIKCHDQIPFNYPELPVAVHPQWHPYQGVFAETFVLKIPNGKACSQYGNVHIGNNFILELFPQNYPLQTHISLLEQCHLPTIQPKKIHGKVLVLTRIDEYCYGHWIGEFLPRLALIAQHNIEYDWIYTCYNQPYIKETLNLLGIDSTKIIEPTNENFYIQAEELIVPSLTVKRAPIPNQPFSPVHPATMYCPEWAITWLRNQFISQAQQSFANHNFYDKVFLSRKDAYQRRMTNEDEIFALFEPYGFKRYTLGNMSFLEQVMLFNQAKHIIGQHGSGLTNLIFCQPGTQVAEIYQNQFDSTFWQLSQTVGLNHHCIKTQELQPGSWKVDTEIPIDIIKNYINQYL